MTLDQPLRRIVSLILVSLTLITCANAQSTRWQMTTIDGTFATKRFDSIGEEHVYFHQATGIRDSVPLMQLQRITHRGPGNGWPQAAYGALALGGGLFVLVEAGGDYNGHGCCSSIMFSIPAGVLGAIVGAAIGGAVGQASEKSYTDLDLTGMSAIQRANALREALR